MRPGPVAQFAIRRIDRYRHSSVHARVGGGCRFTPSCSHFAEDALRTRWLPLALLSIIGRVLRCNPLLNRSSVDPVRKPRGRRLRPRANAVPTTFAVLALSSFIVAVTAGIATAVGVQGGCRVAVNGTPPSQMTKKHPLEVNKGEQVQVSGIAPQGTPAKDPNVTVIKVAIIEGVYQTETTAERGTGRQWGGVKNVDDYLKYGVGLYRVTGVGQGSNWKCTGEGYVELKDGSPLSKPIGDVALVLGILGAGGAAAASRPKVGDPVPPEPEPDPDPNADEDADNLAEAAQSQDADDLMHPTSDALANGTAGLGCLIAVVAIMLLLAGWEESEVVPFAAVAAPRPKTRRRWVHGHPILGFISGLIAGLGITVLAQQYAYWPLTIATAIVFPIAVGLLCGVRAYLGRAVKY